MGIPMASWPREWVYLEVTRYSYGNVPMGIPMASGLGAGFSSKLPAILMGIPMELFLCVFLWLVA